MQFTLTSIYSQVFQVYSQVFIFRIFAESLKYIHQFVIVQNGENFHPQHDVT